MSKEVIITRDEYMSLQDAMEKLNRLEAAGVDNWEGYGMALEGFRPRSELYEEANGLLEQITEGSQIDFPAGRDAGHQIIFSEKALDIVVELLEKAKA